MKKIFNLYIYSTILVLMVASQTNAIVHLGEEPNTQIEFARPLAMGGAFTAVADDNNVFGFNPAGMVMRTGGEFTLFDLAVGVAEDTLDIVDFVSDNEAALTNWENLSEAEQTRLVGEISNLSKLNPRLAGTLNLASYVSGPTFLGLPFHVGYGAFGNVDSSIRLDNGVLVPNISYQINNDIVIPVAVAKRFEAPWAIPGRIGVGLTGKYIIRKQVKRERQSILELDDLESPPVADGNGIGADVGLLYQPTDRSTWGLMIQDFLGTNLSFDAVAAENGYQALPSRDTVIRPRTNVGYAVVPKSILFLLPTHDRWVFTADLKDILDSEDHILFEDGLRKPLGEDFWTHLHAGTEFSWGILRLRGGLNQGYLAFGGGINLFLFKLDYAYYGRELGTRAGDIRQANHLVSLSVKFGTTKVESRERIKSNKEMRKQGKNSTSGPIVEEEVASPLKNNQSEENLKSEINADMEKTSDKAKEVKEDMVDEIPE